MMRMRGWQSTLNRNRASSEADVGIDIGGAGTADDSNPNEAIPTERLDMQRTNVANRQGSSV